KGETADRGNGPLANFTDGNSQRRAPHVARVQTDVSPPGFVEIVGVHPNPGGNVPSHSALPAGAAPALPIPEILHVCEGCDAGGRSPSATVAYPVVIAGAGHVEVFREMPRLPTPFPFEDLVVEAREIAIPSFPLGFVIFLIREIVARDQANAG